MASERKLLQDQCAGVRELRRMEARFWPRIRKINFEEECYNLFQQTRTAELLMARRLKDLKEPKIERPPRLKLSAKESLKRTREFDKRKERFVAAIRKSKD